MRKCEEGVNAQFGARPLIQVLLMLCCNIIQTCCCSASDGTVDKFLFTICSIISMPAYTMVGASLI